MPFEGIRFFGQVTIDAHYPTCSIITFFSPTLAVVVVDVERILLGTVIITKCLLMVASLRCLKNPGFTFFS